MTSRHPSSPIQTWEQGWHNDQLLSSLVNICLEVGSATIHITLFSNKIGQLFTVILLAIDQAIDSLFWLRQIIGTSSGVGKPLKVCNVTHQRKDENA